MRMLQVCAVDFTAYHFLRPLMRASRDDGWDVEFACTDGLYAAELRAEGFRHHAVAMSRAAAPLRQLRATGQMAAVLWKRRPELVHTHTPAGGIVGRAGATLAGTPTVVHTFHGLPFEGGRHTLAQAAYLLAERALARRTCYFFSQARGDLDRAIALGIARREDSLVIGNGVDTARFRPDPEARAATRGEFDLDSNAIVAITVARLVREKGLLELATAALRLREIPELHFLIVGEALPTDRTGVADELDGHPVVATLGPRWRRLGRRTDVARLLAAADVFVLPTYREGLPRSVIEAMAVGLCVISTTIPACAELIEDGVSGVLVPPRDAQALTAALRSVAVDSIGRRTMGERARFVAVTERDERLVLERQLAQFRRLVA